MQFYYGNQMPLRILDEAEFWKHQEEEHTVVIREVVKGLEPQYVNALEAWENAFAETHQTVVRFIESVIRSGHVVSPALYQEVMRLVKFCMDQSLQFIQLCQQLNEHSVPVKTNPTAKVVIHHIIRESEYFIGISQTLLFSS